jgi:hypothetical protein
MLRQSRIVLLLLCLATSFLTGCPGPVPVDSPNPDGYTECPPECSCEITGDTLIIRCDGGGEVLQ